jgi:hypothetical protein
MTLSEMRTRVFARLEEPADGSGYYTVAEATSALNAAERVFAYLTLCLEATRTLDLTANVHFYHLMSTWSDLLAVLHVRQVGSTRVRPVRLAEMGAVTPNWFTTTGTPARYVAVGGDLFGLEKAPPNAGTALSIILARAPAGMSADGDSPEIPAAHHAALIEFAVFRLRAKEGGSEFAESFEGLGRYVAAVKDVAAQVRARARALHFDTLPPELERFDLSALLGQKKKQPEAA